MIDNFVSEYLDGRTPNPCVMCNREIKFDRLRERAAAIGDRPRGIAVDVQDAHGSPSSTILSAAARSTVGSAVS